MWSRPGRWRGRASELGDRPSRRSGGGVRRAFDFYDAQRVGLGAEFATEVQRALERITENPEIHPCVTADVRKRAVRRFPYCIFYRAHVDRVEVIAVFHTSRDPAVWQGRI